MDVPPVDSRQPRAFLRMNPVFADLPNTVFDVMSVLARDLGAINLGQGFPDDPGPADVREKAAEPCATATTNTRR